MTEMQRWSVDLDVGEPRAISASSPGMVVVAGAKAVAGYDRKGARQWRIERPFIAVRTLPDGRTLLRNPDDVRVVDMLGETLSAWSTKGRWAPHPFPDDRVIDLDDAGVLLCQTYDGTVQWRAELGCRPLYAPTVVDREVVVSDATGLRLYDDRGGERFKATIGGQASSGRAPLAAAEGPILPFAGGYLAPFRHADAGSGWYLWLAEHAEVSAFAAGAALSGPACVSGELFLATSPDTSDEGKQSVRAYTAKNVQAWELAVARVVALEGGLRDGSAAVVCSPTIERWEKYREFHPVEAECRVTIVDRSGAVRRDHVLQAPLASFAAHAGDLIYVVRQGALLAIDAT
jgi:hypothetical protein